MALEETRVRPRSKHLTDAKGLPAGGYAINIGMVVVFQDGPRGRDTAGNLEKPNGAFVEDLLEAAMDRLEWYQDVSGGRFNCRENAIAIGQIEGALNALQSRADQRRDRGVIGTQEA